MELEALGFDPWFEGHAPNMADLAMDGCEFARVSAVDRGSCLIRGPWGEIPAELSGRLTHMTDSPSDLPCVGDWVTASRHNDGAAAIVHRVFPRRTFLRRKTPGANVDFQMIAANIDTAFIVQSCHADFNPGRLDRYLVMAADGHVRPVVVVTKTDLVGEEELDRKLALVAEATNAKALALSNVTGAGFDAFRQALLPGRTYCLLGSSGVGKTTLLNGLAGREAFRTSEVSATGEGTHTTTRRQLVVLDTGAMLIDTPGMRELGILGAGQGLETGFDAIASLAAHCRYPDCGHRHEPGCAVRQAVERGELSRERYASYLKLRKESEHYEMSYLDRRKKDKAFGKFLKNAKKRMRD